MAKARPITLTTEVGEKYILDFDRESALRAEDNGFILEEAGKYPLSSTYKLFYFSLYKNHPNLTYEWAKNFLDEQFGGINGLPEGFIERLGQLYAQTFGSLAGESKNAKVRVEL